MTSIPIHAVSEALHWRYSTKKFDPTKKIPVETWRVLEQALVLAPSSYGLQPWKFVVVEDPAVRQKLFGASWGQTQPLTCSHFVVFSVNENVDAAHVDRHIDRIAEVRGASKESLRGYRDAMVGSADKARGDGTLRAWMSHQVYIALGEFMAAAALLAVDTCPMEGIQGPDYDEILGLAREGYATLCACAAGYRAADDRYAAAPKVRFKPSEVIAHR